jgi:RNA-binding protein
MTTSIPNKKTLCTQACTLNPVVIIGQQGLTQAVQLEIERALLDHELIKLRINASTREERKAMIQEICKTRDSQLIQAVGHIAIFYRKRKEQEQE